MRVACACCKRRHHYFPSDLLRIFGDIEVDDVSDRMRCEGCGNPSMTVDMISPIGSEAVGLRIRRLVAIKVQRVPIWRED
ncbi:MULTISPECIES: hypothetical protein [unclassified Chelatococcus]|uniref:hypothetical protein n=1 Tax=unclassified Chelatococcus TaxID=2638111 RepID=UPI0002FB3AAD|nr:MULTISPECIES: hypothetical protein [unclassified Chelatococcus]